VDQDEESEFTAEPRPRGGARHAAPKRTTYIRRRIVAIVFVASAVFIAVVGVSLGGALLNPANGSSVTTRFAEWTRNHGGSGLANWIENEYYTHHQPKVGGRPPQGAIRAVAKTTTTVAPSAPPHLPEPAPMGPLASPAVAGEGQWSPAGRTVGGIPAVYETRMRPDSIHTSEVIGVAWMDTKLLRASLYSGSQIPGGGPFTLSAPVQPAAANSLVAAFNAGFLMSSANGGYYTDGKALIPLRTGAASFVIYKNGSVALGQWGRDATMTPDVVSVRQNLDLLVDNGAPVPGLNATDTTQWGATLGNQVYVWRSGVGITANGALVYVGGPALNITTLANLLVDAGAVRGMELDINTDWVSLATYAPPPPQIAASPANGTDLLPTMVGTPARYFEPYWARDFFTMSLK
jgi:Phosphodiester glycosidase